MIAAGVRADNIAAVEVDSSFSVCETRRGFTDFAKVAFTLTTDEGQSLRIEADRCGGEPPHLFPPFLPSLSSTPRPPSLGCAYSPV